MDYAKYILFQEGSGFVPVIFPMTLTHSRVAARLGLEVVSAGFVRFSKEGPVTYGSSLSMNLSSRDEDAGIIASYLGMKP